MKIPHLVYATIIMFISNFFVRILGFLYKIFLSHQITPSQLGIFQMLFSFLMLCCSLTTTGIPLALNSFISKEKKSNKKHSINVLFISTIYLGFFISIFIGILIFFNSNIISQKLLHSTSSKILVNSIIPAVCLITTSNILRSFYYGIQKVKIPAISQLIEQVGRIIFVYILFKYSPNSSSKILIPIIGISIGEILNILFITILLLKEENLSSSYSVSSSDFLCGIKKICKMSFPITISRLCSVFIQSLSSMLIPSRLVLYGMSYQKALGIYGILTGMVYPFLFFPFTLSSALIVNLIPSISEEIPRKNYKMITKKINFSLLLSLIIGMFCMIIFIFFAKPLCIFIFKNELAGTYLQLLSIEIPFMVLNHTLLGILNSIEKEYIATKNNIIGLLIELIAIYFLIPIYSIYGFIYGTILSSVISFLLNINSLYQTKRKSWK